MIFILFVSLVLRILNLNQSLWLDEAAQAIESSRPFIAQFDIKADFHPPLYHVLLHFWMYVGRNDVWLRLLSVGFGVMTVWVTFRLFEFVFNKKIAQITAFLLAISPFHIWYSQEIRPYALSAFLGILTTYFLLRRNWKAYTISSIFFVYTLYLAPFLLLAHGIYILRFERKQYFNFQKSVILIIISFLPWLPKFFSQLSSGINLPGLLPGWSEAVSSPLIKALPLLFTKFTIGRISFSNKIFYGSYSIGLFLLFLYLMFSSFGKYKTFMIKLIILFTLPICAAFLISFAVPIFAPQRLLYVLPFFYGFWALGIFGQKNYRNLFICIMLLVSGLSVFLYATNPIFQRENWRDAVSFVENNRTANTLVLFIFPEPFAPWQWYSQGIVAATGTTSEFVFNNQDIDNLKIRLVNNDRIFLFHYLVDLTDPGKKIFKSLSESGYTAIKTQDFPGVGFVTVYEKALAFY